MIYVNSPMFKSGNVVRIRKEGTLAMVVKPIRDEDGSWLYEVEPVDYDAAHREVKQDDLSAVSNEL